MHGFTIMLTHVSDGGVCVGKKDIKRYMSSGKEKMQGIRLLRGSESDSGSDCEEKMYECIGFGSCMTGKKSTANKECLIGACK